MKRFHQAVEDHKFLWGLDEAYDMTGGYVDQEDLPVILYNPTKTQAYDILCRQISYWFQVGTQKGYDHAVYPPLYWADQYPEVFEIAERYYCDVW